jgi:O-antigen/teichoic acid export membrane protein
MPAMSAIESDAGRSPPPGSGRKTLGLPRPGTRALAFLWTAGESAAKQIMGLGLSLAVLAFVTPHDLGVYTIAFSIVLVLALIVDDPVSEALIQRPVASTLDWDTGFTINLAIACGMVALAAAVSGPVAVRLAVPELRAALPILAGCIIAGALGNIHRSHLTRELRFPVLVKISLAANLAGGAGALALAVAGGGYWAMIAGTLITNAAGTAMYRRASSWRPRLRIDRDSLHSMSGFAGQSFAAHCVSLMREGALPIILGYASSATAVGYFSLALRISRTLGLFFEDMTRRPLFTLMSRLAQEPQRAASFLLDLITVVGAVALPAFAGLALLGPDAAVLVFGAKWTQAGHLMPLLCAIVFGWFTLHVPAVAMRARGDAERSIWLLAVPTAIDLMLFAALLRVDIETALTGMAIRAAVSLPVLAVVVHRRLGVAGPDILARWTLPLLGIGCMTLCVELLRPVAGTGWTGLPVLLIAGALTYVAVLLAGWLAGDRRLYRALKDIR